MPKKPILLISFLFLLSLYYSGCQKENIPSAEKSIDSKDLSRHTQILSSDEYEGRGPSSVGEEKTIAYIKGEFKKLGLTPGNGESYFQEVPLVSITTAPDAELAIQAGEKTFSFSFNDSASRSMNGL